ncbi:MAG: hypothetical protein AAF612_08055 [Planctomycetota bacterium]
MNRRPAAFLALIPMLLVFAGPARALGGDHPTHPQPVGGSSAWPEGLTGLVNVPGRVHGYWVNSFDTFFFAGDTPRLNAWLARLSSLEGVSVRVVLHPGNVAVKSPWDDAPRDVHADWTLATGPRAVPAPHPPAAGENLGAPVPPMAPAAPEALEDSKTAGSKADRSEAVRPSTPQAVEPPVAPVASTPRAGDVALQLAGLRTSLAVHVYLGGAVKLDELVIPDGVALASSNEIEDFVRRHAE